MHNRPLVICSRSVVLPEGIRPASIFVEDGRISSITAYDDRPHGFAVHDHGELPLLPGLVDTHVHINDPGRADWEGFESATRAAAHGGVTTLVDMPLNSIPATTTVEALSEKRHAAHGKCWVDVGFWGGAVAENADQRAALHEAGVLGFKCFLVPSGVDEFSHLNEQQFRKAAQQVASLGSVLLVHAELPDPVERALAALSPADDVRSYATYLKTRPDQAELAAIDLCVRVCRETRARLHIVHLATAQAVPLLEAARADGLPITVETCPHYLTFAAEHIAAGATEYKCAPPIRSAQNREQLWQALERGQIDLIASDHSPCPPHMKHRERGDFLKAWGGIGSVEIALPAVWSEAKRRGFGLDAIARWQSAEPALLAGLQGRKGAIRVGHDADFVVFDAGETWAPNVSGGALHCRHKLTPYDGLELSGVVLATYLRGRMIFSHDQPMGEPSGELL